MNVNIKIYPAKNGDCFLISFGKTDEEKEYLLIDCGYVDTFQKYLKNDLIKIGNGGGILEKLILTHIDADHIQGAIRFLKDNNAERFITIKEVWHNTYRHLSEQKEGEIDTKQERILQQIIRRGYPQNESKQGEQGISAEQGTTVGALLLQGKYSWNSDFNNQAVCIEKSRVALSLDASIYLLSPDKQKLEKLKNLWSDELKRYDANFNSGNSELYDDAFEMLLSWEKEKVKVAPKQISAKAETLEELLKTPFDEDNTATNGSSIAFVLQVQNKKMLFLADAHPGLIVQSLKTYQNEGTIIFDLIKVAHHGSFGNISRDLLNKIDSERYLISTNGQRNNHPDKETIAHIITRKADFHRKLYFNYITVNSKYFDRKDWLEEYNYSIHYLDQQPYTLIL
ncbi:AVAST type 1 anti-phage system MBL fold metallo-hydrolase Avs1a [Chitinophaga nivalis]|uniref:MBL fold metallo-hydrolase n=1 Tax=Chitinophaga nivalis TaxID=2991709 RepID=A0ABT3IJH4_9BACT|nr:AVAST type 1 anti-phage system MBL fold metallo-hydrolase Avs1a [Chitinophaga nivalis]MCW3466197.1 MBL fold metallo-hydrolase [Chitinophaga nivalis]MCW3484112.1 MBL fold metallo-hydrolase [Chitinophaga nivalis]